MVELDHFGRSHLAGYNVPHSRWLIGEVKRSPAGRPDHRWATEQTEAPPADEMHAAKVSV